MTTVRAPDVPAYTVRHTPHGRTKYECSACGYGNWSEWGIGEHVAKPHARCKLCGRVMLARSMRRHFNDNHRVTA